MAIIMYDGIIFDIDGTLWDSRKGVAEAWNKALREHTNYDITLDYKELGKLFGKPMIEIFKTIFPNMSDEEMERLIPIFYTYEHQHLAENPPPLYKGTLKVLEELSEHYPLFIVTNAQNGYIECLFKATGTQKYFTDWLCYGDTKAQKDVTLKLLAERNNLNSPVYVGDTEGDFISCKKAGIPMIYAAYGLGEVKNPEITISSITELPDILQTAGQ